MESMGKLPANGVVKYVLRMWSLNSFSFELKRFSFNPEQEILYAPLEMMLIYQGSLLHSITHTCLLYNFQACAHLFLGLT